jgi:hypothetical protein
MRAAWLSLLAIPVMMSMALAQTQSQPDRQGSPPARQPQSSSQADRQSGSQADQQSQTKADKGDMKADKQAGAGAPAELKTMSYKGTLVDLACAGGGSAPASASAQSSSDRTATPGQAGQKGGASAENSANRSTTGGGECNATANSTKLGLKMDDGKTVRFDLVGNQRAQDELKNNKKWNKEVSANKPLHVKVDGVLQGDKLVVSSIH